MTSERFSKLYIFCNFWIINKKKYVSIIFRYSKRRIIVYNIIGTIKTTFASAARTKSGLRRPCYIKKSYVNWTQKSFLRGWRLKSEAHSWERFFRPLNIIYYYVQVMYDNLQYEYGNGVFVPCNGMVMTP